MYDIALFFGSFNPIHLGHVSVGRYVLEHGIAHQVWYVVSPENPLKRSSDLAPFSDRVAMARMATADESRFQVCTIEQELPTPSYTYNSITELQRRMPEKRMAILCGSDIEHQLDKWYRVDDIRRMIDFVVYPRMVDRAMDPTCSSELREAPMIQAQATTIRQALMQKNEYLLDTLLSPAVKNYIISNQLYI